MMATAGELSQGQQLIRIAQQLAPDVPLYDMTCTFAIHGVLDVDAFLRAFRRMVDSTDVMRLTLDTKEPRGVLADACPRACELVDLSDTANPAEAAELWIEQRMARPLQTAEFLYDSSLLKVDEEHFVWYLKMHHTITDGWNADILFRRQESFYLAETVGAAVGDFPQYSSYVTREKSALESPQHAAHRDWWDQRCRPEHQPSEFYAGSVSRPGYSHRRVPVSLGAGRSERLRQLADTREFRSLTPELSLFHVFATVLLAWLHRIEQRRELRIGVISHNRLTPDCRNTAGLFMQMLPFAVEMESDETFATLAPKVAAESIRFLGHAVPGVITPDTQKSFDVCLSFVPLSFGTFAGFPAEMTWQHSGLGDPERRLGVTVHDFNESGEFGLLLDFNMEAFSEAECKSTIRHLLATIDELIADPQQRLCSYPLMSDEERADVAGMLDGGVVNATAERTLWTEFVDVANRHPSRIAVESGECRQSYASVLKTAEIIGQQLRDKDVGRGEVVALQYGRDVHAVAGMLGILSADAAFLPIDPNLPSKRIQWLLNDCGARWTVAPSDDGSPEVQPRGDTSDSDGNAGVNMVDAAYVLYTSGSTGHPNGVVVGHTSVFNLLDEFERLAPLPPSARCSWWCSIGFDVTIYEVFSALLYGRTLVVPDESTRVSTTKLFEWIRAARIHSAYLPPMMPAEFDNWFAEDNTLELRRLLVGVEPIPHQTLSSIARRLPALRVINGYGPTESTVCATLFPVHAEDSEYGPAPIGRPVPSTRCLLLDEHNQPVPQGICGELYIGGAGLAIGYFRRPELTRTRFVRDPTGRTADMFFRTGDRIRLRTDGHLEFVGRYDDQVKFRGYRIEPSEVVQAISTIPEVAQSFVAVRPDETGTKQLVAWYSARSAIDSQSLRVKLMERLPRFMVPTRFVAVESMPINSSGKIERQALPDPNQFNSRESVGTRYKAPRSEVEQTLAEVWERVFGHQPIGVHDSFFDLGGDSIVNIQLVAEAEQAGLKFTSAQLFEHSTIAELASVVVSSEAGGDADPAPDASSDDTHYSLSGLSGESLGRLAERLSTGHPENSG